MLLVTVFTTKFNESDVRRMFSQFFDPSPTLEILWRHLWMAPQFVEKHWFMEILQDAILFLMDIVALFWQVSKIKI